LLRRGKRKAEKESNKRNPSRRRFFETNLSGKSKKARAKAVRTKKGCPRKRGISKEGIERNWQEIQGGGKWFFFFIRGRR